MKNAFKSIMLVATAMAFVSCQKDIETPETGLRTLTVHADVEATKTYLNEDNQVLWGTDEAVNLYVGAGETSIFVSSTSTDDYEGEASASFSFTFNNIEESNSYSLGGIYPASAVVSGNDNPLQFKTQLPATQTSVNGNYDPSAYIMVLKPENVDVLPEEYVASFRRATALNKLTLTNVAEDIKSVEITVPKEKYLAGRRYFNLTTGESGEIYNSQTNVVKVNGDFKAGDVDVWFCSWGVELIENDVLTVKMTSETKSYTRSITVRAEGIQFQEGDLNKLTINMGSEDTVIESLTNIEGQYLIASKTGSGWFLMTPTNGGKFYNATSSVSTSNNVSCSDFYSVDNVEDYVWEVSKYSNGYSVMSVNTNKYISYKNSSNEAYASEALADDVKMDIQLNGQSAVIESMNVSGRKLQYNSNSPRFAFYATAQTGIYMIPWIPDTTPRIKVESTDIEVNADATELSFAYELKNASGTVTATVGNNPTITNVRVAVDGNTVNVAFDANDSEESTKTATIILSYANAENVEVVITQAAKSSGGDITKTVTYTFTSKSWEDGTKSWTSGKAGNQYTSGQGVQVTTGVSGANATCNNELSNVSNVVVNYCTNSSKGAGTIKITIGSVTKSFTVSKTGGTTLRDAELDFSSEKPTGKPKIEVVCTTNSIYINSITFTYAD